MNIIRKVNANEIKKDNKLEEKDGWVKMDVQWLCTNDTMGSEHSVFGRTLFEPGVGAHELHMHPNAEEILYVAKGYGIAISGEEEFEIGPGDLIFVPKGEKHYFKNTHKSEIMETLWIYGGASSLKQAGYIPVK